MEHFTISKGSTKPIIIPLFLPKANPDDPDVPLDLTGYSEIKLHVGDQLADSTLLIDIDLIPDGALIGGVVRKDFAPADTENLADGKYYAQVFVAYLDGREYRSEVFWFSILKRVKV